MTPGHGASSNGHHREPLFTGGDPYALTTLRVAIATWEGTPHVAGQRRPGRASTGGGVDCINFVVAVLEECYALLFEGRGLRDAGPMPRPPQDLGVHDPEGARWGEVIAWARRRFPVQVVLSDPLGCVAPRRCQRDTRPGDVLVFSPSDTAPAGAYNHVGVCGLEAGSVWHSSAVNRVGVTRASLGDPTLCALVREIYRPLAPLRGERTDVPYIGTSALRGGLN